MTFLVSVEETDTDKQMLFLVQSRKKEVIPSHLSNDPNLKFNKESVTVLKELKHVTIDGQDVIRLV